MICSLVIGEFNNEMAPFDCIRKAVELTEYGVGRVSGVPAFAVLTEVSDVCALDGQDLVVHALGQNTDQNKLQRGRHCF